MITILFWVLEYKPGISRLSPLTVMMHGGNLILALVDMCMCRQPYYLSHVYAPMLIACLYVLFTIVYFAAGGTNDDGVRPYIYEALNWSEPEKAGRLVALIVIL